MSPDPPAAARDSAFDFSAGVLCLDFANTARYHPPPREDLDRYETFVAWGREAGIVSAAEAAAMRGEAVLHPREAGAALARARSLREAIYGTFSAVAAGSEPREEDVAAIHEAMVEAWRRSRLVPRGSGYAWELAPADDAPSLDHALLAVARSAADLLASPELRRVRECALDTCAWLFVDRSKNQKRRWCDMKVCGNRSKARRHYARARRARGDDVSGA